MDGQVSIEHQIDIHVRDLIEAQHNELLNTNDVLQGLDYVLAYRLRSGQAFLPKELALRLVHGLLLCTGARSGSFFRKKLTDESIFAMQLLRKYTESVASVAQVLGEIPRDELWRKLKPDFYIQEGFGKEIIPFLDLLCRMNNWDLKDLVEDFPTDFNLGEYLSESTIIKSKDEESLPPQVLHFDRAIERVLDMYKTNIHNGISPTQRAKHLACYGKNNIPKSPERTIIQMLWGQINDFMFWLLIISAAVSFYLDFPDVTSAVVLLVVVVMNVSFGLKQELDAVKTLKTLSSLQTPQARVIIGGETQMISSTDLVPGDVIILEEGDAVPADLRLVVTNRLFLNEAVLTGESEPVSKNTDLIRTRSRRLAASSCSGNAFMGTIVVRGSSKGIVVRIGSKTEIGQISSLMLGAKDEDLTSPLQKKLSMLGKVLVILAAVLCTLVLISGLARRQPLKDIIKVSLSLAVSVIPEGLVAVLTLALATATKRLAKQGCIVKRLNVVETLGGVSVIASDKTGTLTLGRMRVDRVWTSEGQVILQLEENSKEFRECLLLCQRIAILCNNANVTSEGRLVGDPTEAALLQFFTPPNQLNFKSLLLNEHNIISVIPFDSERKIMAVYTSTNELLVKGAPEMVLEKCSNYLLENDTLPIDELFRRNFERVQEEMSKQGQRCIALAIKRESISNADSLDFGHLDNLTFVGIAGLIDPPRDGVKESIQICKQAGINVIMITGDHPTTAAAIANQIGINGRVLKGSELDALNEESLAELLPFPNIFARVTPHHKLLIVEALKRNKAVVSMTGDGVNDAPAIQRADIGIAMGITGTDLAKQAASLVLTDDNFCTILNAVQEGRRIRDNIVRFLVYLLACNSAEIWTVLVAVLAGWEMPLSAVNILWANIVADIPPSLALGMEAGEPDAMEEPPKPPNQPILSRSDILLIFLNGLVISAGSLLTFKLEMTVFKQDLLHSRSNAFFVLTSSQILLVLTCKSLYRSLFSRFQITPWMLLSLVVSFGLLLMGHYVPWFNEQVLQLEPVSWRAWIGTMIVSAILLVMSEVIKAVRRKRRKKPVAPE
jgi:P-type Ca2+ transporter type 2C